MRLILCLAAAAATFVTAPAAQAESSCPQVLARAGRLILVTAPDMNRERVTMRLFRRQNQRAAWRPDGTSRNMVIGRAGMAWGFTYRQMSRKGEPLKREGDQRTPAGIFTLGATFGIKMSPRPGHTVLKKGETICVDDARSPFYNTIQSRSRIGPKVRGENMGAISLYRHGLFVEYPSDRKAKAGSCIFIHLLPKSGRGTLGCLALPEAELLSLQEFSDGKPTALVVLPERALAQFAGCLPSIR